jgi:dihydroorotate dehydrogenase (NAD+) catalytic subunit
MTNDISVQIGPVRFKNPVFIASGICGYAEEYSPLVNLSRLGGVVTKTITMLPRPGNQPPRIHELPHGMLNSIGLENVGLERYVKEKLPQLNQHPDVGVMVSVAAETEEEFIQLAEAFAPMDGYAGLELNLSCPNVKGEALDQGRNPPCRARPHPQGSSPKSLWVKGDAEDITGVGSVARLQAAPTPSRPSTRWWESISTETGRTVFARGSAGYSGPGILPSLQKVWIDARGVDLVIGASALRLSTTRASSSLFSATASSRTSCTTTRVPGASRQRCSPTSGGCRRGRQRVCPR